MGFRRDFEGISRGLERECLLSASHIRAHGGQGPLCSSDQPRALKLRELQGIGQVFHEVADLLRTRESSKASRILKKSFKKSIEIH